MESWATFGCTALTTAVPLAKCTGAPTSGHFSQRKSHGLQVNQVTMAAAST